MVWTDVVVLCLFLIGCLLAVHRSRTEGWDLGEKAGAAIFLIGAAIGLYLDDLLVSYSSSFPWGEPVGAIIAIVGLAISRLQ